MEVLRFSSSGVNRSQGIAGPSSRTPHGRVLRPPHAQEHFAVAGATEEQNLSLHLNALSHAWLLATVSHSTGANGKYLHCCEDS